MSPLNWLILFMFMLLVLMLIMILLNFLIIKLNFNKSSKFMSLIKNNFKWMW